MATKFSKRVVGLKVQTLMMAAAAGVLGLPLVAPAAIFTSAGSGAYNLDATWTGGSSNPANGVADTVTIGAHTVSITNLSDAINDSIAFSGAGTLGFQSSTTPATFALAALDLTGANSTLQLQRPSSGGSVNFTVNTSTLTLGNGRTTTINSQNVNSNSTFTLTLNGAATVTGAQTFTLTNLGSGNAQLNLAGKISGTGSLTKAGNGLMYLQDTTNDFSGGVTVSTGALLFDDEDALGTGSIAASSGGLLTANTSTSWTRAATMASGSGFAAMSGQTLTVDLALSHANLLIGSTRTSGKVVLNNNSNTLTGVIAVQGASLEFSNLLQLGTVTGIDLGLQTSTATGTLIYSGSTAANLTAAITARGQGGGKAINSTGSGALTISGNVVRNQASTGGIMNLFLGATGAGNNVISGNLVGYNTSVNNGFTVVKTGEGTWTLSGDNAYVDSTTVRAGTLIAGNNSTLDGFGGAATFNTSTEVVTVAGSSFSNGQKVVFTATANGLVAGNTYYAKNVSGTTLQLSTLSDLSDTVNITGTTGTTAYRPGGAFGIATSAIGLGDGSTLNSDTPTLLIGGAFTVARDISVTGTAPTTGGRVIGGSTANTATFSGLVTVGRNLSVTQVASGTLNLTGGMTGSATANTPTTITFAGPGSINVSTNAITEGSGTGTTMTSVVVSGGTVSLNVDSTYDGTTTVSGGTLRVNNGYGAGSATGTGAVNVTGGTLGGNGTITGTVTISGTGTYAPGNSIGTIDHAGGNLVLGGNVALEINKAAGPVFTNDLGNNIGTLTYGGTLKITATGLTLGSGDSWDLFNFGSQSGAFANDAVFGTSGDGTNLPVLSGLAWNFNYGTGVLYLTSTSGPSPAAVVVTPGSGNRTSGQSVTVDATPNDGTYTVGSTTVSGAGWSQSGIANGALSGANNDLVGTVTHSSVNKINGSNQGRFSFVVSDAASGNGTYEYTLSQVVSGNVAAYNVTQTATILDGNTVTGYSVNGARDLGENQLGTTFTVQTSEALGADTLLSMTIRERIDGTANDETTANDGLFDRFLSDGGKLFSDVVSIDGLDGTLYVLTVSYDPTDLDTVAEASLRLGWLTGSAIWVNAVDGNTGGVANFEGDTDWLSGIGGSLDGLDLGKYGVSTSGNYVWAVLNHTSEFAVIPEPASLGMLALGGLALLGRRRR